MHHRLYEPHIFEGELIPHFDNELDDKGIAQEVPEEAEDLSCWKERARRHGCLEPFICNCCLRDFYIADLGDKNLKRNRLYRCTSPKHKVNMTPDSFRSKDAWNRHVPIVNWENLSMSDNRHTTKRLVINFIKEISKYWQENIMGIRCQACFDKCQDNPTHCGGDDPENFCKVLDDGLDRSAYWSELFLEFVLTQGRRFGTEIANGQGEPDLLQEFLEFLSEEFTRTGESAGGSKERRAALYKKGAPFLMDWMMNNGTVQPEAARDELARLWNEDPVLGLLP